MKIFFCLYFALCLSTSLFSQDCVQLTYSSESGQTGDTVSVDLTVQGADSIILFLFATCFDTVALEYIDTEIVQSLEGLSQQSIFVRDGVARNFYSHPDLEPVNIVDSIPFLSYRFRIKDNGRRRTTIRECSEQLSAPGEFISANRALEPISNPICSTSGFILINDDCQIVAPSLRKP